MIRTKTDLPRWFKLENYDVLNELSDEEIIEQIDYRLFFLYCLEHGGFDKEKFKITTTNLEWDLVKKGQAVIKDAWHYATEDNDIFLDRMVSVHPLPLSRVIFSVCDLINKEQIVKIKDNKLIVQDHNLSTIYFDNLDISDEKFRIHIGIDLKNNTDKVILSHIKQLLPSWRKNLKIKEPSGNILSQNSHIQKIINYKIIPLIDLKVWERLSNNHIPLRVLAVCLYPNGEKGETELKQTVMPFLKKISSDNYRYIQKVEK